MEILCFNVQGKLAHFRKYYANNTALSFTIPPRTSLMGMVAAVMGWPRDSYYEHLASENIRFGVRVMTPLKKSFHRLNLLSIKSVGDMAKKWSSDFRGESGRIQTPFEVVSAWDMGKGDVIYQVFMSPNELGRGVFKEVGERILHKSPVYSISLGPANFMASITDAQLVNAGAAVEKSSQDFVWMHSAVPSNMVDDLQFEKGASGNYNFVEEDLMPGDFMANGNREVRKMNRLLFSTTPSPMRVKLNSPYIQVALEAETINIQFLDS